MEEPRNIERLASVETKLESIEAALIRMDAKLDAWNQNYVPRQEINEMFRARDKELEQIKLNATTNKNILPSWAAVIVAIAAMLVTLWTK